MSFILWCIAHIVCLMYAPILWPLLVIAGVCSSFEKKRASRKKKEIAEAVGIALKEHERSRAA